MCRNPVLAEYRARKREKLLGLSEEKFGRIAREVGRRTRKPLKAGEIGLKVGRVRDKFKVGKHFEFVMEDGRFEYRRAEERIQREKALDGIYVIRTDRPREELSAADTVRGYKNLCRVERAFRCMKTVDLMIRPIRHYREERVRAHLFLCMLAWYVEWHMREALCELLFEDEEKDCWAGDPVVSREPSESAKRKKRKKKTVRGFEVHSFSTLLEAMSTICRNRREPVGELGEKFGGNGEAVFFEYTRANALQSRAFELLEMYPVSEHKNG